MQADAMSIIAASIESKRGFDSAPPTACKASFCLTIGRLAPLSVSHLSSASGFRGIPQTKGWAVKAFEFTNSGPPALLNNPCCCRRVVCHYFLKHAMEVHYG